MNLIRAAAEGKWNGDAVPNSVEGVQSIDSVMDYCYDDGMGFGDLPFRLHIRAEVSPNGVNFLPCKALIRTFVAELEKLSVNCGHVAGGTEVIVRGKGFVPSTEMRVRLRHNQQEWVRSMTQSLFLSVCHRPNICRRLCQQAWLLPKRSDL